MEIVDVNVLFGAYPAQHPDSTAEVLAQTMEAQGVTRGFALSTRGLFYSDAAGNQETLVACRENSAFIPVATLDPTGFWGQSGVLDGVTSGAFQMVRFFPCVQKWPVDFAPFGEILDALARGPRLPIMLDIDVAGDATQLSRVAGEYPHPVILEGVTRHTLTEAVAVLRRHPQFYLETHALKMPETLPLLRDTVGIERVLFGSDAPGLSLGAALRYVRSAALSDDDKNKVLGGNALSIWTSL